MAGGDPHRGASQQAIARMHTAGNASRPVPSACQCAVLPYTGNVSASAPDMTGLYFKMVTFAGGASRIVSEQIDAFTGS